MAGIFTVRRASSARRFRARTWWRGKQHIYEPLYRKISRRGGRKGSPQKLRVRRSVNTQHKLGSGLEILVSQLYAPFMARLLRIEYAGAVYHVTARGNARESIYKDDGDRKAFLGILGKVMERHHWLCHAYCLMGNHYHLVVETPDGT